MSDSSIQPAVGVPGRPVRVDLADAPAPGGMSAEELGELMATFNDVTARLQATHQRLRGEVSRLTGELHVANEQLERSRRLAALGEMAAGIAHEVRNPLGSIGLYARMLEEDLHGQDEPRALAAKIRGAVRTADAIVRDVLAFSREMSPRVHAMDADDLLTRALDCGGLIERLGVEVELDAASAGVRVHADADLVHQALVNIVRNACEAMAEAEGARRLWLGAGQEGSVVWLEVRDSGPGIPPEAVDRMFNPFFTTRATGTGLGLAIVHRIVEAHGGSVRVSTPEGGGASVRLELPASERAEGNETQATPGARGSDPSGNDAEHAREHAA